VLVLGGSPDDRTQLARAFHRDSPNHAGAFVRIDCGRDEPLLAAALQDFLSAAGAPAGNPVLEATGGTLFLDSIASLAPRSQRLLLELVSLTPGGAADPWDGRLIVGNRDDLAPDIAAGRFLAALYDCLDKLRVQLEPGPA